MSQNRKDKIELSDQEWRKKLTPEQYKILRKKGTERPFTNEMKGLGEGSFVCAGCGNPLFVSETKFDSGCGWPSFDDEIKNALIRIEDNSFGMKRVEICCSNCKGHLGHVFKGEGYTDKDMRHCVNSLSIKFIPKK